MTAHVTAAAVPGSQLPGTASLLAALDSVRDPELDEPITALGFVSSCEVTIEGDVDVVLRLPTPQCAPNFAFLMAADARGVVGRVPGVRSVSVRLEDHYTGEEINAALAADRVDTAHTCQEAFRNRLQEPVPHRMTE